MIFLKESSLIIENQKEFIQISNNAALKFEKIFQSKDYTRMYGLYNIFTLTSTNILMYKLFNELKQLIRQELGDRPLWMQSWMNYQKYDNVLDWHNHDWKWHGYITIDPKKTKTIFEKWEIVNKPGQIYFGEGHNLHKVEVLEKYDDFRITFGYDVTDKINHNYSVISLIPL